MDEVRASHAIETVTVTEAKATLSKLLQRVLDGEEIAVGRRGVPEIVLRRFQPGTSIRPLGAFAGQGGMSDDSDQPVPGLPDLFEAEDIPQGSWMEDW